MQFDLKVVVEDGAIGQVAGNRTMFRFLACSPSEFVALLGDTGLAASTYCTSTRYLADTMCSSFPVPTAMLGPSRLEARLRVDAPAPATHLFFLLANCELRGDGPDRQLLPPCGDGAACPGLSAPAVVTATYTLFSGNGYLSRARIPEMWLALALALLWAAASTLRVRGRAPCCSIGAAALTPYRRALLVAAAPQAVHLAALFAVRLAAERGTDWGTLAAGPFYLLALARTAAGLGFFAHALAVASGAGVLLLRVGPGSRRTMTCSLALYAVSTVLANLLGAAAASQPHLPAAATAVSLLASVAAVLLVVFLAYFAYAHINSAANFLRSRIASLRSWGDTAHPITGAVVVFYNGYLCLRSTFLLYVVGAVAILATKASDPLADTRPVAYWAAEHALDALFITVSWRMILSKAERMMAGDLRMPHPDAVLPNPPRPRPAPGPGRAPPATKRVIVVLPSGEAQLGERPAPPERPSAARSPPRRSRRRPSTGPLTAVAAGP